MKSHSSFALLYLLTLKNFFVVVGYVSVNSSHAHMAFSIHLHSAGSLHPSHKQLDRRRCDSRDGRHHFLLSGCLLDEHAGGHRGQSLLTCGELCSVPVIYH